MKKNSDSVSCNNDFDSNLKPNSHSSPTIVTRKGRAEDSNKKIKKLKETKIKVKEKNKENENRYQFQQKILFWENLKKQTGTNNTYFHEFSQVVANQHQGAVLRSNKNQIITVFEQAKNEGEIRKEVTKNIKKATK